MSRARDGSHGELHLIGHSLGTFLSGRHFETYPGSRWDRVALVGGVISDLYDWSLVLNPQDHRSRIQDVRNDAVAWTWWCGLWGMPANGHAGKVWGLRDGAASAPSLLL